jgi:outer membrane autotransporter protein
VVNPAPRSACAKYDISDGRGHRHAAGRFQANGLGARIEGGYRYTTPWLAVTPYGAVQVQSIFLPSYGETATAGSNQFALNYAAQTATTTRTEIGAWFDKTWLDHTFVDRGHL